MSNFTLGVLATLLVTTNRQPIRNRLRTWFDAFDRWASQHWPVTPKGRDEYGQLVEYVPRPEWAQSVTVEFHALIRNAYPLGEAT